MIHQCLKKCCSSVSVHQLYTSIFAQELDDSRIHVLNAKFLEQRCYLTLIKRVLGYIRSV